ncbi:MAG: bifunctional diguanylate cyclase/phosphodiesterase [Lachnospiraceae bacterium]
MEAAGKKDKGVVLKIYIENFKRLNDVFGYAYCESLLNQIITFLEKETGSKVYRYLGVEFIIILEGYSQGQALALAEEIGAQFDHVWKVDSTDCLCSVQMGLCSYPGIPSDADQMLSCLNAAVSKATEASHNQAVMYDSQLHNQVMRHQQIALYLQTAIDKEEIEVRYRPTYNLKTQKFTRAEYYMRIFIQGIGLVGSGEFLPIAEDSGQIRAVEYFALEQVGALIADLMAKGKEFESIALPISPILFLQEDFLDQVKHVIEKYCIPAGKLALEFNESALITAYLNINMMMQELSEIGVELIFNDFGSGFAGMSNILEFPVNTLKFERMFVWQLETNPKSGYVIESLTQMANNLGLKIIAEGVETDNQVALLSSYGCEYQQGFYYSPTMERDVLMDIMDTHLKDSEAILAASKAAMQR